MQQKKLQTQPVEYQQPAEPPTQQPPLPQNYKPFQSLQQLLTSSTQSQPQA